jgi:sugar/nucleoside kinase (ribokinase family)
MMIFDILVAGEINPDLVLSGDVVPEFGQVEKLVDSATLTVGSSSAIFACAAARLGLKVAIVGLCGDDFFGHFMLEELRKRGVDISGVIITKDRGTGLSVILNRGADRAILTYPGVMSALNAEQVTDELLSTAKHLHVASYFLQTALQPGLLGLFRRAHALGLTTSLDTNWDPSGKWLGVHELLGLTDVFLPNENEALALTGSSFLEAALWELGRECSTVVIKRGEYDAMAIQGEVMAHSPVLPTEVIDTVGAGDNFDAGFLFGWLNGWSLEKCLRLANACGSLSTQAVGGVDANSSLQEAMQYAGLD